MHCSQSPSRLAHTCCRQAVKNGTLPIITRQRSSKLPTRDVPELTCAFEALYELSMLLGRLLQLLYGPSGVRETSDREVLDLRSDLRNWKKSLSGGLTFHGPDSSAEAGELGSHLCATRAMSDRSRYSTAALCHAQLPPPPTVHEVVFRASIALHHRHGYTSLVRHIGWRYSCDRLECRQVERQITGLAVPCSVPPRHLCVRGVPSLGEEKGA